MRKFTYLIGTMDDFESIEDLKQEYFDSGTEPITRNMSVYLVEIDPACRIRGYETIEEIATMIGRGEAMTNDWCLDGTISVLLDF
jgi:hypothetical protein